MNDFEFLWSKFSWKPIFHCPGRYLLKHSPRSETPAEILGSGYNIRKYNSPKAKDQVWLCRFSGGGLISYEKTEGFIHTLCTTEGFERKIRDLQIIF